MRFDDGFEKPRAQRTPADYVYQITDSICDSLIKLGRVKDESEFDINVFRPSTEAFKQGMTADAWWMAMKDPRTLDTALRANPVASASIAQNAVLYLPSCYAMLALLFCTQAMIAERDGDLPTAWTYAIDARFAADMVLSRTTDRVTIELHKRGMGVRGAAARLERNSKQAAIQDAKAEAKKLWQERRVGKYPELRYNWQFAAECLKRWPALTSPDVVKGWCTKWEKEARQKSKPAG